MEEVSKQVQRGSLPNLSERSLQLEFRWQIDSMIGFAGILVSEKYGFFVLKFSEFFMQSFNISALAQEMLQKLGFCFNTSQG